MNTIYRVVQEKNYLGQPIFRIECADSNWFWRCVFGWIPYRQYTSGCFGSEPSFLSLGEATREIERIKDINSTPTQKYFYP